MNLLRLALFCTFLSALAFGQQLSTRNPLEELKNQVAKVLAQAEVPFTGQQEKQLALLIEEQKQASENMFGVLMDFRGGPPQGQDRDRALAGIQWMHDEFKKKLPGFLSDPQRAAWERFESAGGQLAAKIEGSDSRGPQKEQIQQIRINNNPFTADARNSGGFGGGGGRGGSGGTQIIERGGTGAFHGNFSATFQDESLNARNPFAENKPPYQERTINGSFSGPLIQDRLSIQFGFNNNRQENVGTVKAVTLDGPFSLGITRPNTNYSYNGNGILQLSDSHSLHFGGRYGSNTRQNQGVGEFNLPERGTNASGRYSNLDLKHMVVLSSRAVHEVRFNWRSDLDENKRITRAPAITVLDAFRSGGNLTDTETRGRNYDFGNLLYYTGEKWTVRTGFDGWQRKERSFSENNFLGEYTFSDLESYRNQAPLKYRIAYGEPWLEVDQWQIGLFLQNDYRVSPRFTLMLGVRYEAQTNLRDYNNLNPRLGFAYAVGASTVIRGGVGVFSQRLSENMVSMLRRLDGTRQYEVLIDNPSWPDPFQSGTATLTPPSSRRVAAPGLRAPYNFQSQISLERSLPHNLFLTVTYDLNRGVKLYRYRNLNAPLPGSGIKPFPDEGHIYQLESTGNSIVHNFRAGMRQRFSIFSLNANYVLGYGYNDFDGGFFNGPNINLPSNNYDLKADWGRAPFVEKHSFDTSVNARLPFNVYLTTNVFANSGNPYNITTGYDDNNDSQTNDRLPGVKRNSGDGPRFFNVSFNLSKAFSLQRSGGTRPGSGPQVSFFMNANNAFNMTNFGQYSGVMTSPFFGRPTNARQPREIEAGMRFQF